MDLRYSVFASGDFLPPVRELPPNYKHVVATFDDGNEDAFQHAKSHGLKSLLIVDGTNDYSTVMERDTFTACSIMKATCEKIAGTFETFEIIMASEFEVNDFEVLR